MRLFVANLAEKPEFSLKKNWRTLSQNVYREFGVLRTEPADKNSDSEVLLDGV